MVQLRLWLLGIATPFKHAYLMAVSRMAVSGLLLCMVRPVITDLSCYSYHHHHHRRRRRRCRRISRFSALVGKYSPILGCSNQQD